MPSPSSTGTPSSAPTASATSEFWPAHLERRDGVDPPPEVLLERPCRLGLLLALRQLLVRDDGRAHAAGGDEERIVRKLVRVEHLDREPAPEQLAHAQHPDVRIPAAAGPEDRRAGRDRRQVGLGDPPAHAAPAAGKAISGARHRPWLAPI